MSQPSILENSARQFRAHEGRWCPLRGSPRGPHRRRRGWRQLFRSSRRTAVPARAVLAVAALESHAAVRAV